MVPPTIIPAKHRVRRTRRQASGGEAPLSPLSIVSVTDIDGGGPTLEFTVTLDVNAGFELTDIEDADPSKWTARYGNILYVGEELDPGDDPNQLVVSLFHHGGSTGPNVCGYAGDPSDIVDTQGRSLGVVVGYPI